MKTAEVEYAGKSLLEVKPTGFVDLLSKLAMFISFFQYLTCAFSFVLLDHSERRLGSALCGRVFFFPFMLLIAFIYNSVCLDLEFVKDAKRVGRSF